jgi:hypothetical protein
MVVEGRAVGGSSNACNLLPYHTTVFSHIDTCTCTVLEGCSGLLLVEVCFAETFLPSLGFSSPPRALVLATDLKSYQTRALVLLSWRLSICS